MMISEIKGMDSYWAFQSFHKLMLGLKMLPSYIGESYEDFFDRISEMSLDKQETFIREALVFVPLEKEEIEALAKFVKDPNGIPYTSENMKSLSPDKIHEILTVVCKEIVKIKVNFVNDAEKKKPQISPLT